MVHSLWLFVKHSWQWETVCRDEEQVDFFHGVVDRLVMGHVFSTLKRELMAAASTGAGDQLAEEYKKLILLLYSHSKAGLSGELEKVMADMGDSVTQLGPITAQVYLDVTGRNPLNDSLYAQGTHYAHTGVPFK